MIDIDKLSDSDIGREVKFAAFRQVKYGKITSFNKAFIFVLYHTEVLQGGETRPMKMKRSGSQATSPRDLEFV